MIMHQQHVSGLLAIRSLVVLVLSAALFSFAEKPGGDSFSIYLNNKLLLEQHLWNERGVKEVSLASSEVSDVLKIQYSHCGKTGTARSIAVLNVENKTMKTWRFADNEPGMELKAGEVLKMLKGSGLHLVYTSTEIPEGKTLVNIAADDSSRASLR
jgi:hypothetical protein